MVEEGKGAPLEALSTSVSRRSFLKTTAVAAGAIAAASSFAGIALQDEALAEDAREEQVFVGSCRSNCHCGCPIDVHVRDGVIVRTAAHEMPDPRFSRICSKGLTNLYRTYSQQRVQHPLKRAGERGEDKWEQISWDQAIDEIATKIKQVQKESGKSSFAMMFDGSGNYGIASGTNSPSYSYRFLNAVEATGIIEDVDRGMIPMYGHLMCNGSYSSADVWYEDWDKAKTLILWGSNDFQSTIQISQFILNAQEAGTKLICIDPEFSLTAAKCDMHIPLRPGSDGLLIMGMMKAMLENGWENVDYLKAKTTAAWLMFADDLRFVHASDLDQEIEGDPCMVYDAVSEQFIPVGKAEDPLHISDGTLAANGMKLRTSFDIIMENLSEYTMEEIAEMTSLSEDLIYELTDIYANNGPAIIQTRFGFNHYGNATYTYTAQAMLPAFCGYYDMPYAGMGSFINHASVNMAAMIPPNRDTPDSLINFQPQYGPVIPFSKALDLWENKTWDGEHLEPRVFYCYCCDVLSNMSNRNRNLELVDKMEMFIVADPFMTDTARYADYVLPCSFWFEQEDMNLTAQFSHPYGVYNEKAIEPLFESKPDFEIFNLLFDALDLEDCKVNTPRDWFAMALDTDDNRANGVTPEALYRDKVVRNYFPAPFSEAPGPLTFVCEKEALAPKWDDGQEYDSSIQQQLHWEPPHEAWYTNELHERFPFNAISQRSRYRTHTQWWDVELLHELDPEPTVKINPEDAQAYGIEDGAYMRVYNDRGTLTAKAVYHRGVQPGTLYTPRGWQESQIVDGHHNTLSSSYIEPWVINQTFYDTLVAIEKA